MVAPLKECKVYFSPVQEGEGDPSPDNVRAIGGWTECELYHTRKNLLPSYKTTQSTTQVVIGQNNKRYHYDIKLPAGTYTIFVNSAISAFVYLAIQNVNNGKSIGNTNEAITFTLSNNSNIEFFVYNSKGIIPENITSFQLEKGSSATSYEPYTSTTLPIDWTTEAGTVYGGYVDLVTGEVWQEWACETANDKSWNIVGSHIYQWGHSKGQEDNLSFQKNSINSHCSFKVATYADNASVCGLNPNGAMYVGSKAIDALGLSPITVEKWTTFLQEQEQAGTPFQVCSPLKTPKLIATLSPSQLKTLRGINNIWSNTNGNIELKYWAH